MSRGVEGCVIMSEMNRGFKTRSGGRRRGKGMGVSRGWYLIVRFRNGRGSRYRSVYWGRVGVYCFRGRWGHIGRERGDRVQGVELRDKRSLWRRY